MGHPLLDLPSSDVSRRHRRDPSQHPCRYNLNLAHTMYHHLWIKVVASCWYKWSELAWRPSTVCCELCALKNDPAFTEMIQTPPFWFTNSATADQSDGFSIAQVGVCSSCTPHCVTITLIRGAEDNQQTTMHNNLFRMDTAREMRSTEFTPVVICERYR